MKAIILAGGNQTRFEKDIQKQSKILFPLRDNETVLSNTIKQLEEAGAEIILHIKDKEFIADYVKNISTSGNIEIDRTNISGLGNLFFNFKKYIPCIYIFGDIYFSQNSLVNFVKKIRELLSTNPYDGIIGVSKYQVGDYNVKTEGEIVTRISKEEVGDYFTCGVFSILNPLAIEGLDHIEKMTDIFSQLVKDGHRIGYVDLKGHLIDLDTKEKADELLKLLN